MKVEFDLTLDDVEAYSLYYIKHSPQYNNQKRLKLIAYSMVGIFLVIGLYFLLVRDISTGIIVIVAGILLGCYYIFLFSNSRLQKRIRKELFRGYGKGPNDVICRHTLILSPEGVRDITDMGESTTHWKMIENVLSTDKYVFLAMTGGMKSHIIPQKAFSADVTLKEFIAESEAFQKNR